MVPILGTCFDTLRAHNLLSNNNGRGYEFCFLFWVPKMIPILGSCFGTLRAHNLFSNNNGRGYEFWFQLWVSLLVAFLGARCVCVFLQDFVTLGTPPRTVRRPPNSHRHGQQTAHASRRVNVGCVPLGRALGCNGFSFWLPKNFPMLVQLGCALCCKLSLFGCEKIVIRFGYNG